MTTESLSMRRQAKSKIVLRRQRLTAVAAAAGAAMMTWILIEPLAGFDLRAPVFDGSAKSIDIGPGLVIINSAVPTLVGWGLLAMLERWTSRPRSIWTTVAMAGLMISLAGPMLGEGVSLTNRWFLELLHMVVAAVYIPLMRRTARADVTHRIGDGS